MYYIAICDDEIEFVSELKRSVETIFRGNRDRTYDS